MNFFFKVNTHFSIKDFLNLFFKQVLVIKLPKYLNNTIIEEESIV